MNISANTQAVLLLTAPLIVGRAAHSSELLTPGEYNRLARVLRDNGTGPEDLLGPEAAELLGKYQGVVEGERLKRLLDRGFLLSQAVERWQARGIWVVSRADRDYPGRLNQRLKEAAPAVLYGCGQAGILETGGLAIVGSRDADSPLLEYAESVGGLAARSHRTVVSGGARGIDQAAMHGALVNDGCAVGVLANDLERLALGRELRDYLMDDRLALVSPYDPAAGFDVGHAMQRNKLIYALADAALVVSSDYEKGGTWAGAIEQLEKLHLVPVYVHNSGDSQKGLKALLRRGALPWPEPSTPEAFANIFGQPVQAEAASGQTQLPLLVSERPAGTYRSASHLASPGPTPATGPAAPAVTPADRVFAGVKEIILAIRPPITVDDVVATVKVTKGQATLWLQRLVEEGVLTKKPRPVRYIPSPEQQERLFRAPD
ncbi:MAG: DNA-protecting protein DprA [Chloroflexi bacterium]|nr:DNA-protecting protein DprA [Chloroflexota bacterium]